MTIIAAALAPVIIILFYIYFRDKYEREPFGLLVLSLLSGMLIVIPVILFEQIASRLSPFTDEPDQFIQRAAYDAFLVAALVEEAFKFLALYILFWKNRNFNEKFDGIVYAVFISLGFAAVENVMYVTRGGMDVAIVRTITAVPAHALFGIRMGYFMGIARMYKELRRSYLWMAFFYPFLLHGIYDFILMSQLNWLWLVFVPYLAFLYFIGFKKMKVTSDSSVFRDDVDLDE